MQSSILKEKLDLFNDILEENYEKEENLGIMSGLSGLILFKSYYNHHFNNNNKDLNYIYKSIELINDGFLDPTYSTGIAGFGWTIDHLKQEKLIDIDNDDLLGNFDSYIYENLLFSLKEKNYELLRGSVGYALYFLNRYKNTKNPSLKENYKKYLIEFLDILYQDVIKVNDKWFWEFQMSPNETKIIYNISLSHGIIGIIAILTKLSGFDDFQNKSLKLLRNAINFVLDSEINNQFSLYPNYVTVTFESSGISRLGWCYGDLGIGINFWYASKLLKDKKLEKKSIAILEHCMRRIDPVSNMVSDASICHGSHGIMQIFNRFYHESRIPLFKTIGDYWLNDALNKASFEDGYAGYKTLGVKDWRNEISLLEGISGIGLTMIDYLTGYKNKWDECLIIS